MGRLNYHPLYPSQVDMMEQGWNGKYGVENRARGEFDYEEEAMYGWEVKYASTQIIGELNMRMEDGPNFN